MDMHLISSLPTRVRFNFSHAVAMMQKQNKTWLACGVQHRSANDTSGYAYLIENQRIKLR